MIRVLDGKAEYARVEAMDFEAEARRAVEAARAQAREMLENARAEAEAIKRRAYEDGYAAGLKAGGETGLAEGRKEGTLRAEEEFVARSRELTSVLEGMMGEFASRREMILMELRNDALEFLLACVAKIVRREISADRHALERAVQQGLALVTSSPVRIQVNPADLEYLRRILPEMTADRPEQGIVLEGVGDVEMGGVRLLHPEGALDLSPTAQLEVLKAAFLGGGDGAV